MNNWRNIWIAATLFTFVCPALAQDDTDELDAKMREAEQRLIEQERELAGTARQIEMERADRERMMRDENVALEVRMRAAEEALADAARQVAELSRHNLPRVAAIERVIRLGDRPVLGITIGSDDDDDPAEGVTILGVSPGGAAAEAGLRAGDVITAINGESLTADNAREANGKLLDFMQGVEEGDELEIEYLRNGRTLTAELSPHPIHDGTFAFDFDGKDFTLPDVNVMPHVRNLPNGYIWMGSPTGLGDMELVKLTERLGSYFGTDEGLLVVRGPKNEELKLQDGDVIQSIDGREPTSVQHAMRILGSYQSGETVTIEIMRDKRKQTISIDIPDNRQSFLPPPPRVAPGAPVAPKPRVVKAPGVRVY